jgi:hypothetical protein
VKEEKEVNTFQKNISITGIIDGLSVMSILTLRNGRQYSVTNANGSDNM